MKAIGSFIIVRKVKEDIKSKSGLIVTDAHDMKIRYKLAEVISVGSDVKDLKQGDQIYYDSAAESEIRIEGEKLSVIPDRGVVVRL
jgi:co-chaperonin GroES (HSP10)